MNNLITKDDIELYLFDDAIIVEAGAHIGRDTVKMAKRWPSSTIHAFEPIPDLFNQLLNNTKKYPNVICYNYALSNITGSQTIYVSSDRSNAASSLLQPKKYLTESPMVKFHQELTVNTITLDDWAKKFNINFVDFLWLDMQGNEFFTLKESNYILNTVSVIYTEINLTQRYDKHPLYPKYKKWLKSKKFRLVKDEFSHNTWGNALFIKDIQD